MGRFRISLLGLFAVALVLAGCMSSGTAFNPPGGTASTFKHMYLTNGSASLIYVYNLPITSTSTAAVTLSSPIAIPGMLFVDKTGRLFVGNFSTSKTLDVYNLPLTASSTPAFTLTTSQFQPDAVTEDAAGNVYVADAVSGGYIDIYSGPVNSSVSPSSTISNNAVGTYGLNSPFDLAFGPNGDLYVTSASAIDQFAPPLSSGSLPNAEATPNVDNFGLRTDSSSRVFVANASANGIITFHARPINWSKRKRGTVQRISM